jgi:hypothetical protein
MSQATVAREAEEILAEEENLGESA